MWLLKTTSLEALQLEYVNSSEERAYAILSHTWEDGEVTFQDMANIDQARKKKGFSKIEWTCRLARQRGINYAWVDTCCINKESSAELTESINSMFKWYKDSAVCFVYLSDLVPMSLSIMNYWGIDFQRCRWFTRGWTLQELIAPGLVEFYDQTWTLRGDKSSSRSTLFDITGIDIEVLADSEKTVTVPVARRMSWAATRQTTRIEDTAYCLFGIFDVNLPLLYGEGPKAFMRLQEEIIREAFDLSMFAWTSGHGDQQFRGIFARSPYEFRDCRDLVMVKDFALRTTDFELTHRAVKFTTSLLNLEGDEKDYFLLNLNCAHDGVLRRDEIHGAIIVPLVRIRSGYVRCSSRTFKVVSLVPFMTHEQEAAIWLHRNITQVIVPKTITRAASNLIAIRRAHRFSVRVKNCTTWKVHAQHFHPRQLWDATSNTFTTQGQDGFTAAIDIFLKGRASVSEWDAATNKDHVEDKDVFWPGFHITLGLSRTATQDNRRADDDEWWETEPLEPWATIYRNNTPNIAMSGWLVRAAQFRAQIQELPSTLTLTYPYIQQTSSFATGARRHSKENTLLLSVSTKIWIDREAGMYEMILSIEEVSRMSAKSFAQQQV